MATPTQSRRGPLEQVSSVRVPFPEGITQNPFSMDNSSSQPVPTLREGELLFNLMKETTGKDKYKLISRPSITTLHRLSNTAPNLANSKTPRGVYYWGQAAVVLYAYGTTVSWYNPVGGGGSTGTLGITLSSNPGRIMFTEWYVATTNLHYLVISDDVNLFVIDTSLALVTTINSGSTANFPSAIKPCVVSLDGYFFAAKKDSKYIYVSNNANIAVWGASSFTVTEQYEDNIVALAKHKQYVIAFGERSVQFFYDAANPLPNSPLARQEILSKRIGLYSDESWVECDDKIYFVGVHAHSGLGIYRLDNGQIDKISSETVDRWLALYSSRAKTAGQLKLFVWRAKGHTLICCNGFLPSSASNFSTPHDAMTGTTAFNSTLVFDVQEKNWAVFGGRNPQSPSTKSFNLGESGTSYYSYALPIFETTLAFVRPPYSNWLVNPNGPAVRTIGLGVWDQGIYDMTTDNLTGNDFESSQAANIDYCIRTDWLDFGTSLNKIIHKSFMYGSRSNYATYVPGEDFNVYYWTSNSKDYSTTYPGAVIWDPRDITFKVNWTGQFRIIMFELQASGAPFSYLEGMEHQLTVQNN